MRREYCLFAVLLFGGVGAPFVASAATVNKCVGADGKVVFTQAACPDSTAGESVRVKPASEGLRVVEPGSIQAPSSSGRRSYNGCSDLTQVDIAKLISDRTVSVGMTAEEATKAWGEPDKINRSSHGQAQWVYGDQYIYVDENGCVTAWN